METNARSTRSNIAYYAKEYGFLITYLVMSFIIYRQDSRICRIDKKIKYLQEQIENLGEEDMKEYVDMLSGVDKNNELFTLWYEVNYQRLLIAKILDSNPELSKIITPESVQEARLLAQEITKRRFPRVTLNFTDPLIQNTEPSKNENVISSNCNPVCPESNV